MVISKLSFTVMGVTDTAMVGRLGTSEQAAVGIATTFMFTIYVFGLGVIGAVNTLVAQYDGAGRHHLLDRVLSEGFRMAAVLGILTWLLLFFSEPLFYAVGLSERVSGFGYGYLLFRIIGIFAVFGYWTMNAFMEGLGNTKTPMWISIIGNAANIVLNYIFIFGFGPIPTMGVEGAGLATALCDIIMFICFAVVIYRKHGHYYNRYNIRFIDKNNDNAVFWKMTLLGAPMGFQYFMEVGAYLLFSVFIGWISDVALAANQIALRVMSISFMTAFGIGTAATTLVGRYQGEGNSKEAHAAGQRAVVLMVTYSVICGILFMLFPKVLATFFTDNSQVIEVTVGLLYVAAIFQVFDGLNMVGYSALKGAGDTKTPLYFSVSIHWLIGVPLVYLLSVHTDLGVLGAWLGMLSAMLIQGSFMYLRFYMGGWKKIKLTEPLTILIKAETGSPTCSDTIA